MYRTLVDSSAKLDHIFYKYSSNVVQMSPLLAVAHPLFLAQ